uniref:Ankyrin repeat-containing protein At5g02620 n=1 Tax=Anthurium amnicola TaxID=1678845 RepID=A0A1D1Z668_9ARAE
MEKQQSFQARTLGKQQSFHSPEKRKSFRLGAMHRQKSFQVGAMDKQQSSWEKRISKYGSIKRGDSPLHLASRAGNLLQVKEILTQGDDGLLKGLISMQNNDGETALYLAAESGHVEVVREILLRSDAQSAALKANNSLDAFHIAAKEGHVDVLKELLSFSPELAMTVGLSNVTTLYTAATQGHTDVVNLLLDSNANLAKIARNNGKTVLHAAARMGHVEVVKSLLTKEPRISFETDRKGQTALHLAVKGQNVDIVMEMVKPDHSIINLKDVKGNTPLHIASRKGRYLQVVQSLLTVEGINVNAINKAGETAVDVSEKNGSEELTAILRDVGAVAAKELENPPSPAKQLKQTVSDIKHDVQSQLQQTRKTGIGVQKIKKRLKKLHVEGLNNAINSSTVVAVLIATIAFAAIFTVPGQYVETKIEGYTLGEAYIANNAEFIIFFVSDSLALFYLPCRGCGPDFYNCYRAESKETYGVCHQ